MPPPSPSSSEEISIATGRFKPLVSLLRHKWLALFIFFSVSALGVPVAFQQGTPVYMARVVLFVSPDFAATLEADKSMDLRNREQYNRYIMQQERMVTRQDVLEEALQLPAVDKLWPSLPGENSEQRRERLKSALDADGKRGSPFILVTITGKKAKGLDIILNAVVDIYLKKSQQEILFDSSGRIDILENVRKESEMLIAQKEQLRTKIAEELGVTTFKENALNPYDEILIESTKVHTEARRLRVEREARFEALSKKQSDGSSMLDSLVNEMMANDNVFMNFKKTLIEKRTQLLTQTLGLTTKHPTRRRAEQEIAKIDQDIERTAQELAQEIRTRIIKKNQLDIQEARRVEEAIADELKAQRQQARYYSTRYNEALALNREIERTYSKLTRVNNRIDFLTIESNAPGFVRLETPAEQPRFPISGGKKKIVLMFVVAALGLGIVAPIGIDMLDKRLRTPGEVHKILGFPPLAWILNRRNERLEAVAKDYLRRMALALERDWHTNETNCFVLTSVKAGGGTTTFTLELAQILSQLGVRTLAVELNAFKPDSRYYQGTQSTYGLTSLLNPEAFQTLPPEMVIIPAAGDLPARLPVGEISSRHLATHGKLRPLLKQLCTRYDLILMDAPPILLSSDAELLGEVAGGVLLVIEAGVITPGELKRAAHLIERLNPPVVGSVLNRVEIYKGGGYFAQIVKEYHAGSKRRKSFF
jgi:Mrp family chromosome partitioning ATPase